MKDLNIKLLLTTVFVSLCTTTYAQPKTKNNSVYLELAGNGMLYSANYDRTILLSKQFKLAPRVGFEWLPVRERLGYQNFVIPLELNVLWAKNRESKNHLELGLGLTFIELKKQFFNKTSPSTKMAKVTLLRLGFRHQKPSGGFMYRIGTTLPIAQDDYLNKVEVRNDFFGGISLGYSF